MELQEFVDAFTWGLREADEKRPVCVSDRSGREYQPGIGPHPEVKMVALAMDEVLGVDSARFAYELGVPYPSGKRQRCDLTVGPLGGWAIEVKLLRFLGDNGKVNDNILMHLLSPYEAHRSAVTDCIKLANAGFHRRTAVMIIGFEAEHWPLDPAIRAFERLATSYVKLGLPCRADFSGLVHPHHRSGATVAWEVLGVVAAIGGASMPTTAP